VRLLGEERGVDAAEHDVRASGAGEPADLVPAHGVPTVNPDPHDIAGLNGADVEGLECLVRDDGIAEFAGGRRG
jgi:hypothetical protein